MRPGPAALTFGPTPLYPLKAVATRARSLAWLVRGARQREETGLRILLYHRVSLDRDPLSVTPRRFREQMDALAADGFEAVDVTTAVDRLASGGAERVVGLSFDDGYVDVVEQALPVLEQHGFRATVFVATGLIDRTWAPAWYERPPPLLHWRDVVELDRGGTLRFGAHSVTHRNLTRLDEKEARIEIVDSKQALEEKLGRQVEDFSYPGGVYGEREERLVEMAGFRLAVTCEPGLNRLGRDRLALRRTQIDARDSMLDYRAKLAGAHDAGLPCRSLYRRARYGAAIPARASSPAYRSM
jgi:peptidoglycan/xylan/chitin deacetylase (PgdA/CDA1 family)